MDSPWILVLVAAALPALALCTAAALRRRRRRARPHDDTLRAGQSQEVDGEDAALRAMGRNAWLRGGGGGI
ncbi:hypothetical protein [Kineococcus sp. SYSU DK004]|uniref:hypothetical protein n=1 Tax=Kineococcus sp. SYSU DK004 TaxID=3383125 RepID=UPI003D7C9A91